MDLAEIEAIRQLKYSYFRFLDTKQFEALGRLLTEDATTSFDTGKLSQRGRTQIVDFLRSALGDPAIVTMHHGHHPEITLVGEEAAKGTWYLEDRVIVPSRDFELHGTALYRDEYVKSGGEWRIHHTGYERIFERQLRPSSGETTSMHTMFDPA